MHRLPLYAILFICAICVRHSDGVLHRFGSRDVSAHKPDNAEFENHKTETEHINNFSGINIHAFPDDFSGINHDISSINNDISHNNHDISSIKNDISGINTDINDDISSINDDILGINDDILGIHTDINDDISSINHDILGMNHDINDEKDKKPSFFVKGKIENSRGNKNAADGYNKFSSLDEKPDQQFRQEWEEILNLNQARICAGVSALDGHKFSCDGWSREGDGGFGRSCALQNGNVFEKAAVNVAVVYGVLPKQAVYEMNSRGVLKLDTQKEGQNRGYNYNTIQEAYADSENAPTFYAAGLSLVIHPWNPKAPTVHMNYRFFQVFHQGRTIAWWFGGGSDLTPSYIYEEDGRYFHGVLKRFCDKHNSEYYPKFKKWADNYYRITHRKETRGIGGIFFDDLADGTAKQLRDFAQDGLASFVDSYVPIVAKRHRELYTHSEKEWQQIRRGRYVEFNLMYDRGTKFGLAVPGSRVESILLSMPLTARWEYAHRPTKNSQEEKALEIFKHPISWV